jgi:hypothetical protein
MKVTSSQIRKIYATARELGIDNDMLHTYVFNRTGSEHISTLTVAEAYKVIDGLESHRIEKEDKVIPGRANERQQRYILDLAKKLGWNDEPWRLKGYLRKYAKVEDVAWLTSRQASNIIEGLKKMIQREDKRREIL